MTRRLLLEIDAGSTHCERCRHLATVATESHCGLFMLERLPRDEDDMVLRLPECLYAEDSMDLAVYVEDGA